MNNQFWFDLCSMFTNQSYFFAGASTHHTSIEIQETICGYWSRPLWWKADPKDLSQQLFARTNCRPRALRWLSLEASFLKRWTTLKWKNRSRNITIPFFSFRPVAEKLKALPYAPSCCSFKDGRKWEDEAESAPVARRKYPKVQTKLRAKSEWPTSSKASAASWPPYCNSTFQQT